MDLNRNVLCMCVILYVMVKLWLCIAAVSITPRGMCESRLPHALAIMHDTELLNFLRLKVTLTCRAFLQGPQLHSREISWGLVRFPQTGAKRHDVLHAFNFAAAHSTQSDTDWAASPPKEVNTNSPAIPTPVDTLQTAAASSYSSHLEAVSTTSTEGEQCKSSRTNQEAEQLLVGSGEDERITSSDLECYSDMSSIHGDSRDDSAVYFSNQRDLPEEEGHGFSLNPYGTPVAFPVGHFCSRRVCPHNFCEPHRSLCIHLHRF